MEHPKIAARKLLREVHITHLPLQMKEVCAHLGIVVKQADLDSKDGLFIQSHKTGKGIIIVNQFHRKQRKRFTIAHEIGHYVLGHCCLAFSDGQDTWGEQEANAFASELLMPEKYLLHLWANNRLEVDEVANGFYSSRAAASIAIEQLYRKNPEILTTDNLERRLLVQEYDLTWELRQRGFCWEGYV